MEYITPEEVRQIELNRVKDEIEWYKKEHFKDRCFDSMYGKGYIDVIDVPLNKLNYYFKVGCAYSLFIITKGIVTALCCKISGSVINFIVVSEEGDTLISPVYFSSQLNAYCSTGEIFINSYIVNIEVDKIESREVIKFKVL